MLLKGIPALAGDAMKGGPTTNIIIYCMMTSLTQKRRIINEYKERLYK
jgi:hypothetical protein